MILFKPFVVFIAAFLFYIPALNFVGLGLLFFMYHVLIKNRNAHVNHMRKVYKEKGLDFPLEEKRVFPWFVGYVASLIVLFFIGNYITSQIEIIDIEILQDFVIPTWQSVILIGSAISVWFTYSVLTNRIVKDQWVLQESEVNNKLAKNRIIKLKDGNFVMLLRLVTFNMYEWFFLFNIVRETSFHYIEDKSAFEILKQKPVQVLEDQNLENTEVVSESVEVVEKEVIEDDFNKEEFIFNNLVNDIKDKDSNEKFSKIFYMLTKIKKEMASNILERLFLDKYISEEEYKKIKSFL